MSQNDRVRELEIKLADSELEIVELKIELEGLRYVERSHLFHNTIFILIHLNSTV